MAGTHKRKIRPTRRRREMKKKKREAKARDLERGRGADADPSLAFLYLRRRGVLSYSYTGWCVINEHDNVYKQA